jgi:predicted SnoaL-like aldol condensation-catalyzing enzyme
MTKADSKGNKAFVLMAFDALFNKRDYKAAEAFWSPDYIQHSASIPQGRSGLFDFIKSLPPSLQYESDVVMTEGDLVMLHGRFSGTGLAVDSHLATGGRNCCRRGQASYGQCL